VQKSNFKIHSSLLLLLLPLTERSFWNDSIEKIKPQVFVFGRTVDIISGVP
jgi:hypothetical protein